MVRKQQIPIMITEPLTRHKSTESFKKISCGVQPNCQEKNLFGWDEDLQPKD